jgi:ProP effector
MSYTYTKTDYLQTLDWLIGYFPNAFSKKPKEIKPLKIGILEDIYAFYDCLQHPEISKAQIKHALQHYSGSTLYLSCQTENAPRVDLFGNEVDVVNKEQAKYAEQRHLHKMSMRQQKKETSSEKNSETQSS